MKLKVRSILLFTLFLFLFTFLSSYFAIPKEICVIKGENYNFNIKSPLSVNVGSQPFVNTNGSYNLNSPLTIRADKKGEYNLSFDLLGIFPVSSKLKVVEENYVYPSGEICGVKILTDGVLVISTTNVNDGIGNLISPSRLAGVAPGDFLTKANGEEIKNTKHFMKIIKSNGGKPIKLEYIRNEKTETTVIIPLKSASGEYVLGMWVRDSTAGLGTLTYYTADKKNFAALGHSITDIDTGEIMPIKDGDLVKSTVISYNKGEKGDAGELIGVFDEPEFKIGTITENCEVGLYGTVDDKNSINSEPVRIGLKNEIKLGKAEIISTIENNTPQKFEIEITKINKQNDVKGLVIKVTDKELIEKTGGIVQGMSGSPIIQNGKIIGAVTHVLVNDPTRGYGIFIENMFRET